MDHFIRFFSGQLFIAFIGLFYIVVKLLLRTFIHRLIIANGERIDQWPVFAWFAVDIAVLTVALSITINAPNIKLYTYQETVMWYLFMALSLFLSCLLYGFFIKERENRNNINPLQSFKLSFYLVSCIGTGCAFFPSTISALIK